jgi:hypothetical protein
MTMSGGTPDGMLAVALLAGTVFSPQTLHYI